MHQKPKNLIVEMVFGSHLYGTATESSDRDFKGIFLPTAEEILLGRIPKTANSSTKDDSRKNVAEELDCEYYSLQHFLRLATQGQTVAIDMLFAPDNMVVKTEEFGWVWDRIIEHRSKLLSKQMQAFVGYARTQATKYSLKGDRLNKLQDFLAALDGCVWEDPIRDYWELLPRDDERVNPQGLRELQIGGKWFGETTSVQLVEQTVKNAVNKYGDRAKNAANMGGADWKALSHAVRVSKELIELLSFRSVQFPLVDAPLLLNIKLGKLPLEEVQNILDRDLAFVELQAKQCLLPDKVDSKFWDRELVSIMMEYLAGEVNNYYDI
jgi:hypothetical protein